MSYQFHREYKYGEESFTWPSTSANLLYADYSISSHGHAHVAVKYNYSVAGKSYTGRKVQYSAEYSPKFIEYFKNNIMPKKEIIIYYSPKNPSLSVIMKGPGASAFSMDWLAMLCSILFIVVLINYWPKLYSPKASLS